MIKISHETPIRKLESISVGDQIVDSYDSSGSVVKIMKQVKEDFVEFKFMLHNKQLIYIMSSSN